MESVEHSEKPAPLRSRAFAVVPTLLTLGNAVCGFGAITLIALVDPEDLETNIGSAKTASELLLVVAALLIFLMRELALPILFCFFAFASPVAALIGRRS